MYLQGLQGVPNDALQLHLRLYRHRFQMLYLLPRYCLNHHYFQIAIISLQNWSVQQERRLCLSPQGILHARDRNKTHMCPYQHLDSALQRLAGKRTEAAPQNNSMR